MKLSNVQGILTIGIFMILAITQGIAHCPPEVVDLPTDFTVNTDSGVCNTEVTWTPPTYSLSCADFVQDVEPANWSSAISNPPGGNGSAAFNGTNDVLTVIGSTTPNGTPTTTDVCITLTFDTEISFSWDAIASGGILLNDEPAYVVGGSPVILSSVNAESDSGSEGPIMVAANTQFCFRVNSNNAFSNTMLDISNFSYTKTEITQTAGPTLNSIQDAGNYTVEYSVSDCSGTVSTCSFNIAIEDNENPSVSSPGNIMAVQGLSCGVDVDPLFLENETSEGLPSGSDNCSGPVSMAQLAAHPDVLDGWDEGEVITIDGLSFSYTDVVIVHPEGACTNVNGQEERKYRILRTWTLVDEAGNTDNVEQRINIGDNDMAPTAVVDANPIEVLLGATCDATLLASTIESGSFDNCGINDPLDPSTFDVSTTAMIRVFGSGDAFDTEIILDRTYFNFQSGCPADLTIELQVTDECGNVGTALKDITIRENIAPIITTCIPDASFDGCDETDIAAPQFAFSESEVVLPDPADFTNLGGVFSDNCGVLQIMYRDSIDETMDGCPNPNVRVLRLYTVVDSCNNSMMCTQTIDINDVAAPTFNCPASQAANTSDDGVGDCAVSIAGLALTNVDDCNDDDLTITYTVSGATTVSGSDDVSNTLFNAGVSTVTYTVEDCNGNSDACSFTVDVTDDESPMIDCSMSFNMDSDSGRCSSVVCYDVEAAENCPSPAPTSVPGFTLIGTFDGHTYFRPNNFFGWRLWEDANTLAAELGGYLVSINSEAEQNFLLNNAPAGAHWIGLRYSPSLDAFKWVSGEDLNYTAWGPGQPGNTFLNGDYAFQLDINSGLFDGWYNGQSILPSSFIIEFEEGPRLELLSGLASGSIFPVGTTMIEYRAVDAAGNADTCMLEVVVEDVEAPVLSCATVDPVQLNPFQCDSVVTFPFPTATDNCGIDAIAQIDMTGLTSGDAFPIGITEIMYEAIDVNDNRDTCSIFVEVLEFQVAEITCTNINLTLDEVGCTGMLTPEMIVGGTEIGCPDSCVIIIRDEHGNEFPNSFDAYDIKHTFEYSIYCGGATCWANVTIEDYINPTVEDCTPDTISCVETLDVAREPTAADNCLADLVLVDQYYEKIECDDVVLGKWIREWVAVDRAGNQSVDTCFQEVFVARTDLTGIQHPKNFRNENALECQTFDMLPNGAPTPSVTGVPRLKGVDLYPFDQSLICNGFVKFEDEVKRFTNDCKIRVQRTWTVGEWHCDSIARNIHIQFIEIVDKVAPQVAAPKDLTVSVTGKNCEAMVDIAPATITDNCSDIKSVFVSTGNGVINANGGPIVLPTGLNTIVYTAEDDCGNLGKDSMTIMVRDLLEPIALCETFTTVSLLNNGEAWLKAKSVDDGSFDNCGSVEIAIRRLEDPCSISGTDWSEEVAFCCEDAGSLQMVALLVTDESMNTNVCMVEVEVQDKNTPSITCPGDMIVKCDFIYDPLDPATYFGAVDMTGTACPNNISVSDVLVSETLDQCRIGELQRRIELTFNGEVIQTCNQTIEFETDNPLIGTTIEWPEDYKTNTICGGQDLDPENLPLGFDVPKVPDGTCNLVGVEHHDKVYPFAGNGACFKIIRTWSVIDWCGRGTSGVIPTFEHEQVIVVENNTMPTITSPDTLVSVCSYAVDCSPVPIKLTASAFDDCTPEEELQWDYMITLEDGSTINGLSNDASGTYPIGQHSIEFTVRDRCGNINKTSYSFRIDNCKAPTAYCKSGLSTALIPMDTIGNDSIPDAEMSMLTPMFFDNGSSHVCGYDIQLSFSSDVNDTLLILDCDDLGRVDVQLWVTDINGNQSFCQTFIDVIDSNDVDICLPRLAEVSGRISNFENESIVNTEVALLSTETVIEMTDAEGVYTFGDMPLGGDYNVVPTKDGDDMNGISTLDLVLIQRHILGLEEIDNPYLLIAADVNHDDKISASDLVELRKLVLGVDPEFMHNTSWRFVDGAYQFPVSDDPWAELIQEEYQIAGLAANMNIDFVGVKIGDVNGSATPNLRSIGTGNRNESHTPFIAENKMVQQGELVHVDINSLNQDELFGLQMILQLEGLDFVNVLSNGGLMSKEHYHVSQNELRISLNNANREVIPTTGQLFTFVFKASKNGALKDMISIQNSRFNSEAYVGEDLTAQTIELSWRDVTNTSIVETFNVAQNEPNPWSDATQIEVDLPKEGMVKLTVADATGKVVYSQEEFRESGNHTITLTRDQINVQGVLIYTVQYNDVVFTKKMISIK